VHGAYGENTFLLTAALGGKPFIPAGFYFVTLATGANRVALPVLLNP
jgi:hypothetical protein